MRREGVGSEVSIDASVDAGDGCDAVMLVNQSSTCTDWPCTGGHVQIHLFTGSHSKDMVYDHEHS